MTFDFRITKNLKASIKSLLELQNDVILQKIKTDECINIR